MATWAPVVTIGEVDVSARLIGRIEWKGEANAARTGTLRLSPAAGTLPLASGYAGQAVTVSCTWDGTTLRRFTGWVAKPAWDAKERVLTLTLTDRLQNQLRGLYAAGGVAALQLAMPGALWEQAVHAANVSPGDGWDVAERLFETAPYSFSLGHDGAVRWLPWAGGVPRATLGDSDGTTLGDNPPTVELADLEDLQNQIGCSFEGRSSLLHQWTIEYGWASEPVDICGAFYSAPWWLPSREMIRDAANSAGDWAITAGGIHCEGLPVSGTYWCGSSPRVWVAADPGAVTAAQWSAVRRWTQRAVRTWKITVTAPDSVAAYGVLVGAETASLDQGDADGWDGSKTSPPPAGTWFGDAIHTWMDTADQDAMRAGAVCLASIAACKVLADHRRNRITLPALPGDIVVRDEQGAALLRVADLDIGDRVRVDTGPLTGTGTVEAISEYWDIESGDAETTLTLAVSQCPGSGGTSDTVAAGVLTPEIGYALTGAVTYGTHIGGRSGSPAYDESWRGWVTDEEQPSVPANAYGQKRFAVETPDVPAAARETEVALAEAVTVQIYPPHDELVVVA